MAAVPIANLSGVVTGAVRAAMGLAAEMLPTEVTRDAVLEAARAWTAWFLHQLWVCLVAARAEAAENFWVAAEAARRAAGSAVEASGPWLEIASKLLDGRAAMGLAAEMLPTEVTRDAVLESARAWTAWFLHQLWVCLVAASAEAAENFSVAAEAARRAAGSAVQASGPWLEIASKLLDGLYGRLVAAIADAMASKGGHVLLLVLALLPAVFLCGAGWALTCRTMKGPGLGGARVPRALFKASPRGYFAAVRSARKARRGASEGKWKLLVAAAIFASAAYLVAKTIY